MDLLNKLESKTATIGVMGMDYVGLPLAVRFCEEGFRVIGFDIDSEKIRRLAAGESSLKCIQAERISDLLAMGRYELTNNYDRLSESDCIIICVSMRLNEKKKPDLNYLEFIVDQVAQRLRPGQLVSLEGITYPGLTREILLPRFGAGGFRAGHDYYLIYAIGQEDPDGSCIAARTVPKVIGGITPACARAGQALYAKIADRVVVMSSPEIAEFAKILENAFLCVNIALVNELKMLAERMNLDIWEVIDAAATKPFRFMPFNPGPGVGGHCIPIDPCFLSWKAKEFDFTTRIIELAGEINAGMPYYIVSKAVEALNSYGKPLKDSRILILGIAYTKDIADASESPAFKIIELLAARGALVEYHDPFIPTTSPHLYPEKCRSSVPLDLDRLGDYDLVILVTDHSSFPYEQIHEHSRLILDTQNAFKTRSDKIIKA